MFIRLLVCSISLFMTSVVFVSVASAEGKPVVLVNVVQAESELTLYNTIERVGGINKFDHS